MPVSSQCQVCALCWRREPSDLPSRRPARGFGQDHRTQELARGAGVSHAAPAHHFTDRRGLFTALATQGFQLLAEALIDARGHFADAALAYVRFAIEHPGHYQVMFNKSLLDVSDAELAAPA